MRYLVLSQPSEQYAKAISRALYRLSRPSPDPDDVTTHFCGFITHPTTGDVALVIPEDALPVSQAADPAAVTSIITGRVTPAEERGVRDAIMGNRGKRAQVLNFIPGSASQRLLTQAQAEQAGWFAQE